mmetsp:Transcript_32346/g.56012  ORF Transcript_32346/g.56012 Transcript_32346/m.56012 type:complete len:101 (-) Transcript_32346:1248-1550(-)
MMSEPCTVTLYHCMYLRCGRSYTKKCNLKRHVEVKHLRMLKFKCEFCNKKFTTKQILIEHQDIHTGSKSYECSICNQMFRLSSQLSTHRRTHRQEQANAV